MKSCVQWNPINDWEDFASSPVWEIAVACDVYDGVFLCCPFSPRDVLDEIMNLIESVSEGFPTYSWTCHS